MGKANRYNIAGLLMKSSYQGYRLLLVHAHPDDETINNGATMAMYAALGAQVTLVTCTRGEEGEVLVPTLANLASTLDDKLGEHRVIELTNAMRELGVTDFRFLGAPDKQWRDSGIGPLGSAVPAAAMLRDFKRIIGREAETLRRY